MGYSKISKQTYYSQPSEYGEYQFISIDDIIDQFMVVYTGDEKILGRASRTDVAFFAQRNLAELSFDTFKSIKALELEVPSSLSVTMPIDYVNYVKLSWVDSKGIKRPLYKTSDTIAPLSPLIDDNKDFIFNGETGDFSYGGELVINGNFNGTEYGWTLIAAQLDPGNDLGKGTLVRDNQLEVKDVLAETTFAQQNLGNYGVEIENGVSYKITFTISEYTSGKLHVRLVDELGHTSETSAYTTAGTHTVTLTAGLSPQAEGEFTPNAIEFFTGTTGLAVFKIDKLSLVKVGAENDSTILSNFQSATSSEVSNQSDDYEDDTYWPNEGERYGLDPSRAQVNGSFYIDEIKGKINFGSNISGKTVILEYISDSLGTNEEMKVHKFAEDAMYKSILCDIMLTKANVGRGQLAMYKKDKFAAVRKAKLRLSNIKLEDLTRILRGKSKHIKH